VQDIRMRRILSVAVLLWGVFASAHPLGNFSVSRHSKLEMTPAGVRIFYVLDLAEIPSFELLQKWGAQPGNAVTAVDKNAAAEANRWIENLSVKIDGRTVKPKLEDARLGMSDGAANMPVVRVDIQAFAEGGPGKLEYADGNYADRAGWKEIVVVAGKDARVISSTAGETDQSSALKAYPTDLSIAPPQVTRASVSWEAASGAGGSSVAGKPAAEHRGEVVAGDFMSDFLGRKEIPFSVALIGIATAFGLGAVHALSPGHGKAMVAAYLIGARGTARHALILGSTVTFTHTISVFLLGFVTLFLSKYILPEKLYPILGAISGLMIVWLGAVLLYRRAGKLAGGHSHSHDHSHSHSHEHAHVHAHSHEHHHHDDPGHSHSHDHGHDLEHGHRHDHEHGHVHTHDGHTHSHMPEGEVTLGSLITLGVSGGMVPCPTGLVLLLSSIALGRVALGLVLLTAFSAGLASVLIAIGLVIIYAKQWIPESKNVANSPLLRVLPVLSAFVILLVGLLMTAASLGWVKPAGLFG
jgi:nickel/cobalt transporter (NicO) family protein